jgi:hypothetical protein
MKKRPDRDLPEHLTDNTSSKCFVFRHPNYFSRKSVVFSYARGKNYEQTKAKAVQFTKRMNRVLPKPKPLSPEGRMSSRNKSGTVRIHPKRDIAKRNGLPYYFWVARWKGCPFRGGVSWPCLSHTDDGAYVLAALTLEARTIDRKAVLAMFEAIKGTSRHQEILSVRPEIPIEEFWPD